ncbi:MAG TPA: dihydropteroate synthase [Candidatus Saccharimonadales bacterium]|nr:dihydropteroate synthase [Candidatus Saccharimonadales bacterium]
MRPRFQWNLGRRTLPLGERTLVMGVLNVTPDSFSDGGRYLDPAAAVAHGLALLDEGADILDIGGESTRPGTPIVQSGAEPAPAAVTARQELDRVLPIIQAIKRQRPQAILSIDTYKSTVARAAIDAGVEIVNDVSGFLWDSAMADTIAQRPCGAILMHVRGLPHQWIDLPPEPDIVTLVREGLRERTAEALDAGIARSAIVLDPGFGFGKNLDENYPLLAHFAEFQSLGLPLLAAVSRKGFLGQTVTARFAKMARESSNNSAANVLVARNTKIENARIPPDARDNATLAASVAAALAGAHIIRVHAVRPAVEALAIADAILRSV